VSVNDIHGIHEPVFTAVIEENRACLQAAAVVCVMQIKIIVTALHDRVIYRSIGNIQPSDRIGE